MKRTLISLAALLVMSLGAASAPAAELLCGERADVVASLEKTYHEAPVAMGLAGNGSVIEVFASSAGSFTIVMTKPGGLTCLVASGEGWENLPRQVAAAGAGI